MNRAMDDQTGQSQIGGTDEDRLLGATGDDGLLCTALDEVIPRLEDGRANTALHTRNRLARSIPAIRTPNTTQNSRPGKIRS